MLGRQSDSRLPGLSSGLNPASVPTHVPFPPPRSPLLCLGVLRHARRPPSTPPLLLAPDPPAGPMSGWPEGGQCRQCAGSRSSCALCSRGLSQRPHQPCLLGTRTHRTSQGVLHRGTASEQYAPRTTGNGWGHFKGTGLGFGEPGLLDQGEPGLGRFQGGLVDVRKWADRIFALGVCSGDPSS